MAEEALLTLRSPRGRLVLLTVTLGSATALLDSTVVNIAVRTIGRDLDASLTQLQWVVNGYLLSLASLILIGGALGDRWGRRRMYLAGVTGFAICSGLCAVAGSPDQLISARVLQGVFAAALTPGSLAILQAALRREDRPAAIGIWAGASGLATAIGPFVGGFLLEHGGWRWIFAINLPLCVLVVLLGLRIPETRDQKLTGGFDLPGAALGVIALAATTFALTSWSSMSPGVLIATLLLALAAIIGFVVRERRPSAMIPLELFSDRVFTAANLMTFLVYGALGGVLFLLVLQLQVTSGYGPIAAGISSLPITVAMLLLSARFAVLAQRIGPRLPMTLGPLVCAMGTAWLSFVGTDATYWTKVLPGMVLFALGLSGLVAPLTAAVLGAAPDRHVGIASGVNNAVARAGSLLVVAALPAAVGLHGAAYDDPQALTRGFHAGLLTCAALLAGGGVVSWWGLRGIGPASVVGQPE